MEEDIKKKERYLEHLSMDNQIEDQKLSLAQKKALEAEAKKKYGPGWRKILGYLKPNMDSVHSMYASGVGDLKDLSRPENFKKLGR